MTATIPAGVETARDLVGPAIAVAVRRLSPDVQSVAAYHLGLAGAGGQPAGADGRPGGMGKALRPALALLSTRA
ncbi:MAG TPA: polyprenyl synthetase family protein, partial [Streptosporangiaceae bacterium]|nr:polyprenyl synthetase family protein [Streptosporangiaceae bacterium]